MLVETPQSKILKYELISITKDKIKAQLDYILNDKEFNEEYHRSRELTFGETINLYGAEAWEKTFDRNFYQTCSIITKELGVDTKKMTMIEYYEAVAQIKKLYKKQENGTKNPSK